MDTLALKERIQKTIELGESQFREFKTAYHGEPGKKRAREIASVRKDIAEAMVAFANADGGELLVGVEDDRRITGIPFSEEQIATLLDAPKNGVHSETPLQGYVAQKMDIDHLSILYFSTDKSTRGIHQTSDGRCLQRRDLESVPVSASRLQFERQEQISRAYDRGFVEDASVTDLDLELVRAVSDQTSRMSPEKSLQYLGLGEYGMGHLRLRRAALLLFAKDINHWHPRCQVRIVRVRGTEFKTGRDFNVFYDEYVSGNILQLLQQSWEKLRPHLVETKLNQDALFREQVMYPEDAVREALINAITHRDYSAEGKGVEINVFDDRMIVKSPGPLLSTINIDDLRKQIGAHETRNAYIGRVLKEIGYVREMGEGMRRIFQLMNDADLVPPKVESIYGQFTVSLFHKSVFSAADQAWLSGFKFLKLTREEMLVAMYGRKGSLISPQQIYDLLGLHDWDVYRTVFEQLSIKEVIYSSFSEKEKRVASRKKRFSNRAVPRLLIRQPEELELAFAEILSTLSKHQYTEAFDFKYAKLISTDLSESNCYKKNPIQLTKLLKAIAFIDDLGGPLKPLMEVWNSQSNSIKQREPQAECLGVRKQEPLVQSNGEKVFDGNSVYIGNIPYEVSAEDLHALFEKYGEVLCIKIPPHRYKKGNRGYAFITMNDRKMAEQSIAQLQGQEFMGRLLKLDWATR